MSTPYLSIFYLFTYGLFLGIQYISLQISILSRRVSDHNIVYKHITVNISLTFPTAEHIRYFYLRTMYTLIYFLSGVQQGHVMHFGLSGFYLVEL